MKSENENWAQEKSVYALIDPRDNSVRYVGASQNLSRRLKTHLRGFDKRTGEWVKELKALGLEPRVERLAKSTAGWNTIESRAIYEARETALNVSSGGFRWDNDIECNPGDGVAAVVGRVMRQMRVAKGLTQSEAAATLDITQATISRWENGARTPDIVELAKVADAYGSVVSFTPLEAVEKAKAALRRGKKRSK